MFVVLLAFDRQQTYQLSRQQNSFYVSILHAYTNLGSYRYGLICKVILEALKNEMMSFLDLKVTPPDIAFDSLE